MNIDGHTLVQTCFACPEQYDVYFKGDQVGYLRLRHGDFTVRCPKAGGEAVANYHPKGDGMFEDDERDYFLKKAIEDINNYLGVAT